MILTTGSVWVGDVVDVVVVDVLVVDVVDVDDDVVTVVDDVGVMSGPVVVVDVAPEMGPGGGTHALTAATAATASMALSFVERVGCT